MRPCQASKETYKILEEDKRLLTVGKACMGSGGAGAMAWWASRNCPHYYSPWMHILKVRVIALEKLSDSWGARLLISMVILVWCRIFSLIFQKALHIGHKSVSSLNPSNGLTWCSRVPSCGADVFLWRDETVAVYIWFLCMVGFDILSCSNKLRRFLSERTLVSQDLNWQHWRGVTSYNMKVSLKQRKCMKLCSFVNKVCEIHYM